MQTAEDSINAKLNDLKAHLMQHAMDQVNTMLGEQIDMEVPGSLRRRLDRSGRALRSGRAGSAAPPTSDRSEDSRVRFVGYPMV